ncbi:hypothetical protein VTL71DRAFT_8470 [Oculimacula yallundae]|uniref:Uncharacterized protein n=1 Tax=Oculimacula yallundae TaxID=86028 RepID=A0ABR4CYW2_9HELO
MEATAIGDLPVAPLGAQDGLSKDLTLLKMRSDPNDSSENFCTYCQSICEHWISPPSPLLPSISLPHFGSLMELDNSASSCSMCAQFNSFLAKEGQPHTLRDGFWIQPASRFIGGQLRPPGIPALSDSELIYGMATFRQRNHTRGYMFNDCVTIWIPERPIPAFDKLKEVESKLWFCCVDFPATDISL